MTIRRVETMFVIEHPTFDMETLVAVGVNDDAIIKWIKKNTVIEADADLVALITCVGHGRTARHGSFTMLRLDGWKGTNKNIAHLAHEAFHLAEFVYDRIGIRHDVETSGEAFAYFIQYTVEQVLDGIKLNKAYRR